MWVSLRQNVKTKYQSFIALLILSSKSRWNIVISIVYKCKHKFDAILIHHFLEKKINEQNDTLFVIKLYQTKNIN